MRETGNIGARDLDVLIANFLLQVRGFFFLICDKKTISMKILVLSVITGHVIEIALYGVIFTRCLCQKLVPCSFGFSHKQLVNTTTYPALSMT